MKSKKMLLRFDYKINILNNGYDIFTLGYWS